jgi:hypothetical protein
MQEAVDRDHVGDACDNCVTAYNPDQQDLDRDSMGDRCDLCTDKDGDAVCSGRDNCAWIANPSQADSDDDRVGDACDNCPAAPNADQADADRDGAGDACDACHDPDRDGVCAPENCPDVYNPGQEDGDADGIGEACDVCPGLFDPGQADADGDGTGDPCDFEIESPPAGASLTCEAPATIAWSPASFDRFFVLVGWAPDLRPEDRMVSEGWIRNATTWTPIPERWRRACRTAGPLYIQVLGRNEAARTEGASPVVVVSTE